VKFNSVLQDVTFEDGMETLGQGTVWITGASSGLGITPRGDGREGIGHRGSGSFPPYFGRATAAINLFRWTFAA
jgi:hypothetical protein